MGVCCSAFQSVSFICILSQLSAEVFVALLIRNAISGLNPAFSFTNSDNAFQLTPSIFAASVTDRFKGFTTSSRNTLPGCVGFLVIIAIPLLQNPYTIHPEKISSCHLFGFIGSTSPNI
jgi:hypothetical protein